MCNCMHCVREESVKCLECECLTLLYEHRQSKIADEDCIVPMNGIYTHCCDYEWESFDEKS